MGTQLQGVRVLLAGTSVVLALAAQRLADLGATVVARAVGGTEGSGASDAVASLEDLIRAADVLLVDGPSTTRGVLGVAASRAANSGLVYCAVTTYGDHGPMAGFSGGDVTVQALSGVLRPGASSSEVDAPRHAWGTELAALGAVAEINAALVARSRTGTGSFVDIALVDSLADVVGRALDPAGASGFAGVFASGDERFVALEVPAARWSDFCDAIGLFDLRGLARAEQIARAEEVRNRVSTSLGREPCAAMLQRLLGAGVAATPALTPADALAVPHIQTRGAGVAVQARPDGFRSDGFPTREHETGQA